MSCDFILIFRPRAASGSLIILSIENSPQSLNPSLETVGTEVLRQLVLLIKDCDQSLISASSIQITVS